MKSRPSFLIAEGVAGVPYSIHKCIGSVGRLDLLVTNVEATSDKLNTIWKI
jgi:hypothetical protein